MKWHRLSKAVGTELNLYNTLLNGQCFNWTYLGGTFSDDNEKKVNIFRGVLGNRILELRQNDFRGKPSRAEETMVEYRCLSMEADQQKKQEALEIMLNNYFQLDEVSLSELYKSWQKSCPRMKLISKALPGMRILRQDPFECLISFICSSNNNIPRIRLMLKTLRENYGEELRVNSNFSKSYAFPTLNELSTASEEHLRKLGFGYRAKFIVKTVKHLRKNNGLEWLQGLREVEDHETVRNKLMELHGVGRKVADCVALFSLDSRQSIPVDTHVWQIACKHYDPSLMGSKSLTPSIYNTVGQLFIDRFGKYAGWAHCLLFAAELPAFHDKLPAKLILHKVDRYNFDCLLWLKYSKNQVKRAKVKQRKRKLERTDSSTHHQL